MASPIVRATFGVLVLATIAAFFVTQQLKSEFPLVLRFATHPSAFSPNGDGYSDTVRVGFDLAEPASVSFSMVDSEGNEVRHLVENRQFRGSTHNRFVWDGRDDDGNVVPDGIYRMRVVRRDEGRVINSLKEVVVDTRPPRVVLTSAKPGVIAPGEPGQRPRVTIRYAGPRNHRPEFRIFRTDDGPPRVVQRFRGDESRTAVWNGLLRGHVPDEGDYAFTVTVRDRANNRTVAPAEIPSARTARPHTGVSVRRFTLTGPVDVVPAGAAVPLTAGPFDRSLSFAMSRLGDPKVLRSGGRIGGRFRVHVPRNARTGIYLVRVRAGGHRAVWPLAVAGLPPSRRAASRARPLVVLPAISWQGLNPVDDDLDGFADTLTGSRSVRLQRFYHGGGLPPRFRAEILPLLEFLDREKLAYDLTTDVSLARKEGPALGNAPGVAFAGSALWLPPALGRRLRRYVADGGRVVSFGAGAFKRGVHLTATSAVDPTGPRARDAFGERTSLLRTSNAPMQVFEDGLDLFADTDDLVGDFTVFEETTDLAPGARLLTGAGREPARPALVAYGLGGGMLVRSGTPQWAGRLSESELDVEVPRVTKRIWSLVSGGETR
ncbi:MAG TPA: N,N-dimethylformamidase beta subunit family domain-containing protein [Thermoleophilaceae bacterium]